MTDRVSALKTSRRQLGQAGMRVTDQRALILDVIAGGKGHLDADEIYRRAREKQSRLSLSTVYRTLQRLKELGMVKEVHLDEKHHHYEVKSSAEHHHLVCLGCGKVVEFDHPLSRYITRKVSEARGFVITKSELSIAGYCPACQNRRDAPTRDAGEKLPCPSGRD